MSRHNSIHTLLLYLVLLALVLDLGFAVGDSHGNLSKVQLIVLNASLLVGTLDSSDDEGITKQKKSVTRDKGRERVRRSVQSIFQEHGPYYVRRAYRMTQEALWELHEMLEPLMGSTRRKMGGKVKRHCNGGKKWTYQQRNKVVCCHKVLCWWETGGHCY
jgi:hypothetical protein